MEHFSYIDIILLYQIYILVKQYKEIVSQSSEHYPQQNQHMSQINTILNDQYTVDSPKQLVIVFRKLIAKMDLLNGSKVTAVVKVNSGVGQLQGGDFHSCKRACYQISKPRLIKNRLACFYGESIIVAETVHNFNIQILGENSYPNNVQAGFSKILLNIQVGPQKLAQLQKKSQVFSFSSDTVELIWQAQIKSDKNQQIEQRQQDLLLQDIPGDQLENQFERKSSNERKMYSPAAKGEPRRKRQSFRLRVGDRKSQLHSQSPYKLTMDTNQTIIKIKKKLILASPTNKNKNENFGFKQTRKQQTGQIKPIRIDEQSQNRKQSQDQQKLKIQLKRLQQIQQMKKTLRFVHPVLSPQKSKQKKKQKSRDFQVLSKEPLTPQHRKARTKNYIDVDKKKRNQKFYEKLSIKSLLYTGVIGIIGGVAAAHF